MARPHKQALEYFPFDVDFFDSAPVRAVSAEFGIKGELCAVRLLCAVFGKSGYFAVWNENNRIELLGKLPGVSPALLEQIVKRLVQWGMFDKSLFDSASVLTSKKIQEHYFYATRRRRLDTSSLPYLLIRPPGQKGYCIQKPPLMYTKTELMYTETPQKETENKFSLVQNNPPPPPRAYACVREEVDALLANTSWIEQVCMRFRHRPDDLRALLDEFATDCQMRGRLVHDSLSDCQSHFLNWLLKKQSINQQSQKHEADRRSSEDYVAQAQQAGIAETARLVAEARAAGR